MQNCEKLVYVQRHKVADMMVITRDSFPVCSSLGCFTGVPSFSIMSCFYSVHLLLQFET